LSLERLVQKGQVLHDLKAGQGAPFRYWLPRGDANWH
jgi:hypothetical protein